MKKSKYQQYFHCFIVCILGPHAFWFNFQQNIVNIPISAVFRSAALIRRKVLISMWIPKSAVLIRGQRLFEVRCLLEEIRYTYITYYCIICTYYYYYYYIYIYILHIYKYLIYIYIFIYISYCAYIYTCVYIYIYSVMYGDK